jgi:hypothetical protein
MPKLRTTIEPEKELEVSEAEALDLERLGLVLDTRATTDEGARRAAVNATRKGSDQ